MGIIAYLAGRAVRDENLAGKNYADPITGLPWVLGLIPAHVANAGRGTSSTSLAVGLGSKSLTITGTGGQIPAFGVGQRIRVSDNAAPATNWMTGVITAWDAETGATTFTSDLFGGAGMIASWTVTMSGEVGPAEGAPNDPSYLTLGTHAGIMNERTLTPDGGIEGVDAGAGGTYTIRGAAKVNAQTGASYALAAGDRGKRVTRSNASAMADTIAQAGSAGFEDGWYAYVDNIHASSTVTITPATSTINGAATYIVYPGTCAVIWSDGANYRAKVLAANKATNAEIATGTDDAKYVTPAGLVSRAASESATGLIQIGTASEHVGGASAPPATKAATPAYVHSKLIRPFCCRLTKSGADLQLAREAGELIFIAGVAYVLPSTPITVAPAGAGTQLVYIYAYSNSGTPALEYSATAPAVDGTYGHLVKTGDAARVLVGMAYAVSSAWVDTLQQRLVASYYNRRPMVAESSSATSGFSTSGAFTNWGTAAEFLSWGDETVLLGTYINGFASSGTETITHNVSLDAAPAAYISPNVITTGSTAWYASGAGISGTNGAPLSRGRHTIQPRTSTPSGTGWTLNCGCFVHTAG